MRCAIGFIRGWTPRYDENGKIKGKFIATGNIPDFCQDLARRGIPVDLSIFQPPKSL